MSSLSLGVENEEESEELEEIAPLLEKIIIALLLITATFLAFGILTGANGVFESILGEEIQARIEAPLLEELLKPLGLILLGIIHVKKGKIEFLESLEAVYMLGFLLGGLIGILENFFSYGFFSGFRSATPFVHALNTGIFAIGLHHIINKGTEEIKTLLSTYLVAVIIHMTWNNIGLDGPISLLRAVAIAITVGGLSSFWHALYRYQKSSKDRFDDKRSRI